MPGREEARLGKPFSGFSGRMLDRGLAVAKLTRDDIKLMNVVNCVPPDRVANKRFSEAIRACQGRLRDELADGIHRVIVPMGNEALRAVKYILPQGNDMSIAISKARGGRWPTVTNGQLVMPTHHPAFLAEGRSPKFKGVFLIDWSRIGRALRGALKWDEGVVCLNPTVKDIREWMKRCAGKPISFDIETDGVAVDATVTHIGFSTGYDTIVIPFWTYGDDFERRPYWSLREDATVRGLIQKIILDAPSLWAQNGQFDTTRMESAGWALIAAAFLEKGRDTMLTNHIRNSELPKGLGDLGSYYTDAPRWKDMVEGWKS